MQTLAEELDNILAAEVQRIYAELYQMYIQKTGAKQLFLDAAASLVNKKMYCFSRDISWRVLKLIPDDLTITNDERIFTTQAAEMAKAQQAKRQRQDELQAAGKTFALLIAQSHPNQPPTADIFDVLGLLAEELSTADGCYLIQAIAKNLESEHQLTLKQLRPLRVDHSL